MFRRMCQKRWPKGICDRSGVPCAPSLPQVLYYVAGVFQGRFCVPNASQEIPGEFLQLSGNRAFFYAGNIGREICRRGCDFKRLGQKAVCHVLATLSGIFPDRHHVKGPCLCVLPPHSAKYLPQRQKGKIIVCQLCSLRHQ